MTLPRPFKRPYRQYRFEVMHRIDVPSVSSDVWPQPSCWSDQPVWFFIKGRSREDAEIECLAMAAHLSCVYIVSVAYD